MRVAIVAGRAGETNPALAEAWRALELDACVLAPEQAVERLGAGDVALLRLDILPTLDGCEPGLDRVPELRRAGVRILNPPWALLGAHDKLATARRLRLAAVPHPRTVHVVSPDAPLRLRPPVVVKPRYGSWGRDVALCANERELHSHLAEIADRGWFIRHGALVQELVRGSRNDLRVIVARDRVVGAAEREPAAGEWRTNISLGGRLLPRRADVRACALARAAVAAVTGDLIGVDLVEVDGDYVVLELNAAVDFDRRYGPSVYEDAAAALELTRSVTRAPRSSAARTSPSVPSATRSR
jgi:RimK family alpha-L-glutamate ligase